MEAQKTIFTPREAAEYLGVSYRLILKWIDDDELKCYRIDKKNSIRISSDQINEFLKNHETERVTA